MKKYVTFVKNKEESRKVQEALFKAGFKWCDNTKHVCCEDESFLQIDVGGICYLSSFHSLCEHVKGIYIPIDSSSIISDPFQLDGATQPEKMIMIGGKEISESTIKAALQEYVK